MKVPQFLPDHLARRIAGLPEGVLDTTDDLSVKLAGVSRRDFLRISARYGTAATLAAASSMGGVFSAEALAQTANSTYEKRFAKPAKHVLKFGATVYTPENIRIQRAGVWEFCQDVEEKTDGEIRFEIFPAGSVCAEPVCMQKMQQGVIDIGASSTANAASNAPWLNALDFPYMFRSRGQLYHFFFNPKSEPLFRSILRKRHKVELLWTMCEMRNMFMGARWRDKPPVTSVTQIAGTKNRVTNTQIGRIAMQLMNLNPVPVAFTETLDAMKSGLIDGMETWTTAVTAFNITPVVSQYVGMEFFPGVEGIYMRAESFDKLGGALGDTILEGAFQAQRATMYSNEAGLAWISGEMPVPPPGTFFEKEKVVMNFFTPEAKKEAAEMCSPRRPEYQSWHDRLNDWAGFNVYEKLSEAAAEYPADKLAIDVEPRRWWKSA